MFQTSEPSFTSMNEKKLLINAVTLSYFEEEKYKDIVMKALVRQNYRKHFKI